ncbi:MAG: hypothetical protein JOY90_20290 [Bradyrhizobium sp.]|uniref:hypothetical protein n=1 Tax=Bradyrhizobium sp. TaxID=376 RepID=UPI001D204F74|nr:hypothetical protein [Bradyrhizobium sp.]MBV9562755.1 hypothetical protein [Bradyrhizobium sp.]
MSEVISFGNIVNSLLAVRDDYHQHLKTVPQYDAFLLVESSTERVANTLEGIARSDAPSMAGEVIEALETAKTKFRQHLTSVPEYRALLAIDKLISDISMDLGVQPASQAILPAETQPTASDAVVVSPEPVPAETIATEAVEMTVAAEQAVVVEATAAPAAAETAAPIPQETTLVHEAMFAEEVAASAQAQPVPEVSSADAISQVQMALRSAEVWGETAPVAEAENAAGLAAEPIAPTGAAGPSAAEPSPIEQQAVGQETEKAA